MNAEREHLQQLINLLQQATCRYDKKISSTPIQAVVIPGNDAVKEVAGTLQDAGMDVRPILYPTVPKGSERLRIVLHAFNSLHEVQELCRLLQ